VPQFLRYLAAAFVATVFVAWVLMLTTLSPLIILGVLLAHLVREGFWLFVAWIASRPAIAAWIIARATRRDVCLHIPPDGANAASYMERRWLINRPITQQTSWFRLPFEVRVHWIKRPDADRDMHDHPWNWRTIVLAGWYVEKTAQGTALRDAGSTAGRKFTDAHMITEVSPGGVWTLFIVGPYRQKWGFHTPAGKVPYDKYDRLNGF
jgi:hypothetical protein